MPDLWGVDDEKEAKQIQLIADRNALFTRDFWIGLLICGVVSGGVVALADWIDQGPRQIRGGLGGAIGGLTFWFWMRRRRHSRLRPILAQQGRCTKCGHNLKNNEGRLCPECGETVLIDASKSDLTPRPQIR